MKNDALCLLYIFSLFISGCAVRQKPLPVSANIGVVPTTPQFTERQQRYTLVELKPETSRMNLQLQPVEINLLDSPGLTIGAALRHTLRQTGFSLCPAAERSLLYMLPLPAIHRHSGRILLTINSKLFSVDYSAGSDPATPTRYRSRNRYVRLSQAPPFYFSFTPLSP